MLHPRYAQIMMKPIISISLVLVASLANAHQDAVLVLEGNKIVGLPEKYSLATFDVGSKVLIIGDKRLQFPVCLSKYFLPKDDHSVELAASWYHEPELLPPYLSIDIRFNKRDYAFQILINMDSLGIIHVEVHTTASSGLYMHPIDLGPECKASITQGIGPVNS